MLIIGRFDELIYVPPPDFWGRQKILNLFTKSMPIDKNVDMEEILEKTDGFTGADLKNLCNIAGQHALMRNIEAESVTNDDFLAVLQNLTPSVSAELVQKYKSWKRAMVLY